MLRVRERGNRSRYSKREREREEDRKIDVE